MNDLTNTYLEDSKYPKLKYKASHFQRIFLAKLNLMLGIFLSQKC
jgi:hypothetical protein